MIMKKFLTFSVAIIAMAVQTVSKRPQGSPWKESNNGGNCERIELNYAADFGRCGGENSFESIRTRTRIGFPPRQEIQIGETRSRSIYGSILDDVNFTTPIGIQFWSKQTDNVATPTPTFNDGGFYATAGFLLDPIHGEVGANSTLYKSSIIYQEYVYRNDENKDDYYDVVKYPMLVVQDDMPVQVDNYLFLSNRI